MSERSQTTESSSDRQPKTRYLALTLFVSIFVVAIVGVLSLNFYMATAFNIRAQDINLAGRQRMLTERLAKDLLKVKLASQTDVSAEAALDDLALTFELFDDTLVAFDEGGKAANLDGNFILVSKVSNSHARRAVESASALWESYRNALKQLLVSDRSVLDAWTKSTRTAVRVNGRIFKALDNLVAIANDDSSEIAREIGLDVEIIEEQRLSIQKITKLLFDLALVQKSVYGVQNIMQPLREKIGQFDTITNALLYSISSSLGSGNQAAGDSADEEQLRKASVSLVKNWRAFQGDLQTLLNADGKATHHLNAAIRIDQQTNSDLLRLMNQLTIALENDFYSYSAMLRKIQVAGIILALLMFAGIIFHFVRQMKKADVDLLTSQQETDQILHTVNDGLFLLDRNLLIGSRHSTSLAGILRHSDLAGQSLLAVLARIVPDATVEIARDYLTILLGKKVNERLVADLNPLETVEVNFSDEHGAYEVAYLAFTFKRVESSGAVTHLLVQVDDVSQRVSLEKELEVSKERAQEQLDLLVKVLHVDPKSLLHFLLATETALERTNELLQTRMITDNETKPCIEQMFRLMHAIKGDAATLELDLFVGLAHDFEDDLDVLRHQRDLSGHNFSSLTVKLKEFMRHIAHLRTTVDQFDKFGQEQRSASEEISNHQPVASNLVSQPALDCAPRLLNADRLAALTRRLASAYSKNAEFVLNGEEYLPDAYHATIDQVLVQLVGNSVVHGIELPLERSQQNKAEVGTIQVTITELDDGHIDIYIRDDGRGLDASQVRQVCVEKGIVSEEQASALNDEQSLSLVLKSGYSSAKHVDANAGRGVGMDVVAQLIDDLHGQLSLRSTPGEYCEVFIRLPNIDQIAKHESETA